MIHALETAGSLRARYERSFTAARLQNMPFFAYSTDRPQALVASANIDDFCYNIARFSNVIVTQPYFLPILANEKIALYEYLVSGPASWRQEPGHDYSGYADVDVSSLGPAVQEPCVLLGGWVVWYHWLVNFLPRIYVMELAASAMPDLSSRKILVPGDVLSRKTFVESLHALGIDQSRIYDMGSHPALMFEDLVIPNTFPNNMHSKSAINFLSDRIRRRVLGDNYEKKPGRRRTYISRDGGGPFTRRVVNNDVVDPILREFGFDIVRMEELSFARQVEIMNDSSIVVGPHGSGLTNMIFANAGSRFLEIGGFAHSMFTDLAELLDIEATTLLLPLDAYVKAPWDHAHWTDYVVDPSLLRNALSKLCD